MVSGSRPDGGTQILPARVRKTIQSIKEIVGNHSEADIYVMLKETNMDPNETAQKLLNQDPFHEVKRRRDKRKENTGYKVSTEPRKPIERIGQGTKSHTFSDRVARRGGGYSRNALSGISREFRIVRDNRISQNSNREAKPASLHCSTSGNEQPITSASEMSLPGVMIDKKHLVAQQSDGQKLHQTMSTDSGVRHTRDVNSSGAYRKDLLDESRISVLNSSLRVQGLRPNDSQQYCSKSASSNSIVGVYSSSSDPVHVPSPDSRLSANVGAIKREVGVVGVRRQSTDNSTKHASGSSSSFSNSLVAKDVSAAESFRPSTTVTKNDQLSQIATPESVTPSMAVGRSFLNNQYHNKSQQFVGHPKAAQSNMEWKPKSSQKSNTTSPGVIGPVAISKPPPVDNSSNVKSETAHLRERLSQVNIFDNQQVIIPQHLRVPEAERTQLTFGSFGVEFSSTESFVTKSQCLECVEESNEQPSASASVSDLPASSEDASGGNQGGLLDEKVRTARSDSMPSSEAAELQFTDKEQSSGPRNLENFADIRLVRNDSPSFSSAEPRQEQDSPGLPKFSAYDSQVGYDGPFFRPAVDENVRVQGLVSPSEALNSHTANSIPASTTAMLQQPVAQLYPQVHLSHYPNFMPYRQFLSPVYVPPMAVPGYSSNPSYPHPSNGSSYVLMPGGSSHITVGGLKYGNQQYKPMPAGSPTGFGNYTSLTGYTINAPGVIGGTTTLEDSNRIKYKDGNLYVPNPQGETSEIWLQAPREVPGLQSSPYYNIPGQAPHAAYLPSHTGHASFNTAPSVSQSTHMQFPGMYHPPPQPAAIANPHHIVHGMGGNVGVAAASPGAQVGAYQQPQLGHLNWTTNF
ncbi:PREDICTED: GBF-interacting protein 1-like isoform X2 [Nelumbo nucifera]|uniref:GBF-interacting protein 1-like isoform X2 n=1 Tax=Nelumbo nucifera TaxID=4432 RepID=A0A1U8B3S1_NELNU|nr:PREDICTED: GBF-interacting protein 1-like isoform X2 [Nelumbo nucifera]